MGAHETAECERGQLDSQFSDLTADTSAFAGQSVEDQIPIVNGQIADLTRAKQDATWPNGSDEYAAALDQYASDLGTTADALDQSQIDAFIASDVVVQHNAGVDAEYDPQIGQLQDYAAQLAKVDAAQAAEQTTLTAATRGRTLDDATLVAFQERLVDGC